MVLSIVPIINEGDAEKAPANVKLMDYRTFNMKDVHPFIATHDWEYIDILVDSGIKSGYISQLIVKNNILKSRIRKDTPITLEIISRFSEIFPQCAKELRKAYLSKSDYMSILIKEGVVFE